MGAKPQQQAKPAPQATEGKQRCPQRNWFFLPQVLIKQNPKTTIEKIALLTIKPIQRSITAGCCRVIPDKTKVDKQTIH